MAIRETAISMIMASSAGPMLSPEDYKIACICPMGKELAAMIGMLDAPHQNLALGRTSNAYTFGHIGPHNIVIAVMPATGNNRAASTANQLVNDFPSIHFALLVGIGGGVPTSSVDIRLGDVVVCKATGEFAAVVQYDMGKIANNGTFKRTGFLKPPSRLLMASVEQLQGHHLMAGNRISHHVAGMLKKHPRLLKAHYSHPGTDKDHLFAESYLHNGYTTCKQCDLQNTVKRATRPDTDPEIHYGPIGSGNAVIKDAAVRDHLGRELGVLCVEMEAAGLTNELDCLVVRGISDYADSHKNDKWQPYAAATAAGYAKELLLSIPSLDASTAENIKVKSAKYNFRLGTNTGGAPKIDRRLFVGHDAELQQISKILLPHPYPPQLQVVILGGPGGVGKTQLALEWIQRNQHEYDSVFWVHATSEDTIKAGLRAVFQRLSADVTFSDCSDDDQVVAHVRSWLSDQHNTKWALIYDNHDDPQQYDIRQYYPFTSQGSIIITTQSPQMLNGSYVSVLKLEARRESLDLLQRRSGRTEIAQDLGAQELVHRLDGFPLALATAGAFLKTSVLSCKEYLQEYDTNWRTMEEISQALPEYRDRTLYTTWNMSYKRIEKRDPIARDLLRLLVYFDNQDIWFSLVAAGICPEPSPRPGWYTKIARAQLHFESAMRTLVEFCLVQVNSNKKSYSLHTCVRDWTLHLLDEVLDKHLYSIAFLCVATLSEQNASNVETQHRLVQHAERLLHPSFRDYLMVQDYHQAFYVAYVLMNQWRNSLAKQMYELILKLLESDRAHNPKIRLRTICNLALIHERMGEYGKAADVLENLLAEYNQLEAPDPRDRIEVMNSLGFAYQRQNKLAEAGALHEQAFDESKRAFGRRDRLTLTILSDLGVLHYERDDLKTAESFFRQALAKKERLLGKHHLSTLDTMLCMSFVYREQKRLTEAAEMLQRVYEGYVTTLGDKHPKTLEIPGNLAIVLYGLLFQLFPGPQRDILKRLYQLIDLAQYTALTDPTILQVLSYALMKVADFKNAQTALYYTLRVRDGVLTSVKIICDGCERQATRR